VNQSPKVFLSCAFGVFVGCAVYVTYDLEEAVSVARANDHSGHARLQSMDTDHAHNARGNIESKRLMRKSPRRFL
jgi:hypothetical protein